MSRDDQPTPLPGNPIFRQGDIFHESDLRTAAERKNTERAIELGEVRTALIALLDCVDYTASHTGVSKGDALGYVISEAVIQLARNALRVRS